jgi:hypothetical protein
VGIRNGRAWPEEATPGVRARADALVEPIVNQTFVETARRGGRDPDSGCRARLASCLRRMPLRLAVDRRMLGSAPPVGTAALHRLHVGRESLPSALAPYIFQEDWRLSKIAVGELSRFIVAV